MIAATVALLVALAVVAVGLRQAAGQPAPLSTPALKQRLAEAQARLWAWEVEYESPREDRPGVAAKSYLHRVVAAKAPDRFYHWSAHGVPWLDWQDDPKQLRLTVTADRVCIERPLDRFFVEHQLRPDEPLPGSAPNELWLIATGWWPLARRPSTTLVDRLPAALSAVAKSSAYLAQPRLEQFGGRWCHVLECPGRDRLWLDVERGCAVVARQICYPDQGLVHRVEFADFRQLPPGIWAPFTLRNLHYERAPDGALGRMVLDGTLTVLRIQFNEAVDDARFRFQPLPGSAGKVDNRPFCQAVPGGEHYLDEVVEWIHRYMPEAIAPMNQTGLPKPADFVVGAVFAGVMVTALTWRCRSAQRQGGEP